MSVAVEKLAETIDKAKEASKNPKMNEAVELSLALRDIDLKKPTNRINLEVIVPNALGGKARKLTVIAEGDLATKAQAIGLSVITKNDLEVLSKEPMEIRKLAKEYAFFVAMAPLMPLAARYLGKYLGPRGKMPKPIPPNADIEKIAEAYTRTVQVRIRTNPVINVKIGQKSADTRELAENASAIISSVTEKLERGSQQISKITFKTTMGKPVKVN